MKGAVSAALDVMGAAWQLPGYQVLELVGFGGSGEVWRARAEATGEVVALKRLHSTDAVARERLRREAAVLSSVAGEHVVRVRDVVMTATDAVLVMDYAEGGNLATVLAVRGELAGPEVVTLVAPLAMALADAHDRGIVHGDVTPANIVFAGDGRPLLTDFGVARAVGAVAAEVEVTAPYAAPEVLTGAPASPDADVYSLCRVAATALARATAPEALVAAVEAGLVEDPHDRPDARRLATDVLRACAAAPVRLVRAAPVAPPVVTSAVRVRPTTTVPEEPVVPQRGRRRRRRARRRLPHVPRQVVAGVVAAAALFLAVAGGVVWGHRTQSSAAVLPRAHVLSAPPTVAASPDWPSVIRSLELTRSRALSTGDASVLRSVYATGSPALTADLLTLQRLAAQHLHVDGFSMRLIGVNLVGASPAYATLRVTDQVSAYTLRGDRTLRRVAATPPRTFTMLLARAGEAWRIAEIHP